MMATIIVLEPYFFWVCLIVSIVRVIRLIFDDLDNLTIHGYGTANDPKYGKDGDKNASRADPFVQIQSNKKTKNNATRHRKTDLHDDGEVFGPHAVFFIVENHFFTGQFARRFNQLQRNQKT
jgi:hypothetical protein